MSCFDAVLDRLTAQRSSWTREFQEMVDASLPGNLTHLYNQVVGPASDITAYTVDALYNGLEGIVMDQVEGIMNQFLFIFTYSDEIQIALFRKLSNTLKDYVQTRITLVNQVDNTTQNMIRLLDRLSPSDNTEIVRQVTRSERTLQTAINYLKAVEGGLRSHPPVSFQGYLEHAGANVEAAINILGGGGFNDLPLEDIPDAIDQYAKNTEEYYRLAITGLLDGLNSLASALSVTIPGGFTIGALTGLNLVDLTGNNTLSGIGPKIKSTAQLAVAFPFHIATLNHLIDASYNRVHNIRTAVEDIRNNMSTQLNTAAVSRGNYSELYTYRILWVGQLNLVSTMIGNNRGSLFGDMQTITNDLINNVNAITGIINYLARPNYIKDINAQIEGMARTTSIMIPSLFAAVANANSHARARSYLYDIKIHCNLVRKQDTELLAVLRLLDVDLINNPDVDHAMEMLTAWEEHLGDMWAHAMGIDDGSAAARVAGLLTPGVISNIAAPLFNVTDDTLSNILDDEGFGYDDLSNGNFFGSLGQSLASLVECAEEHNTATSVTEPPDGSAFLNEAEALNVDTNQSVQNSLICMNTKVTNNTLMTYILPDPSIDETFVEDYFEEGIL